MKKKTKNRCGAITLRKTAKISRYKKRCNLYNKAYKAIQLYPYSIHRYCRFCLSVILPHKGPVSFTFTIFRPRRDLSFSSELSPNSEIEKQMKQHLREQKSNSIFKSQVTHYTFCFMVLVEITFFYLTGTVWHWHVKSRWRAAEDWGVALPPEGSTGESGWATAHYAASISKPSPIATYIRFPSTVQFQFV